MHNPFLMLNFQCQVKVKVMSKSRCPTNAIFENGTFELFFIVVDLTFSEPKHMFIPFDFFFLVFRNIMGSRTNSALLLSWQLWATLIICIIQRWPPELIWKISFPATCLKIMYKPYFYRFSGIQNYFKLFAIA